MDSIVIHPFNGFAGSQKITRGFQKALTDAGHNYKTIVYFGRGFVEAKPIFGGIKSKTLRMILFLLIVPLSALRLIFVADIVYGMTSWSVPLLLLRSLFSKHRSIVYLHEISKYSLIQLCLKIISKGNAEIIFVSHFHKDVIGLNGRVISNFIDEVTIQPTNFDRVLFVGAATKVKGFDLFIEVASRIKSDSVVEAFISSGSRDLIASARNAGVHVHENVSDRKIIYGKGGILLHLTNPVLAKETFGLTLVEAAAYNIPVVVCGSTVAFEILGKDNFVWVEKRCATEVIQGIANIRMKPLEEFSSLFKSVERFNYSRFSSEILKLHEKNSTYRD